MRGTSLSSTLPLVVCVSTTSLAFRPSPLAPRPRAFPPLHSTLPTRIGPPGIVHQRDVDPFLDWAAECGVARENFEIDARSPSNWGAAAAGAAPAGSRVLFVPGTLRLTSSDAREGDFAALRPAIDASIDPSRNDGEVPLASHFYLFLKVLQERARGTESPYAPWLDAMPRTFSTALGFDGFEMGCLPPFVRFLAERDRENFDLFATVLGQLDTPTIGAAIKSDPNMLRWAFNVVFTRARPAFGEAEIIPVSDTMNHAWDANCEVRYDEGGNVHVMLLRDVAAGEPLHKCYGQPTNPSRFMATYGFFDASPPTTYCKLLPTLAVTPELRDLGFEYDRMVFGVGDGGVAEEVWDVMLYLVLGGTDPAAQRQFYRAHLDGDGATKEAMHRQSFGRTCHGLLEHVNEVLDEIAECEDAMDAGGMGLAHKHLPVIRRHNTFVRQVFTKVQRNLQQMMG